MGESLIHIFSVYLTLLINSGKIYVYDQKNLYWMLKWIIQCNTKTYIFLHSTEYPKSYVQTAATTNSWEQKKIITYFF